MNIFEFDQKAQAAYIEDILTHNARLHVIDKQRYAKCLENVIRCYAEFFEKKTEYREAARKDFQVCVDAHRDMLEEGLL